MEVVQDDNSSAFTLSKIIAGDLGLTSKVLKIVNSAVYGFEKQITSIRQAIVVLGFTTIRGIVRLANEEGIKREDIVSLLKENGQFVLIYFI